jgi:hypothetical protein
MEAGLAIGGDELKGRAGQAPTGEIGEKRLPGTMAFMADDPVIEEFARSLGRDAVGDQDEAPFVAIGRFHAHADGIEEQVPVPIGQRPCMERLDGAVEDLGDLGDGGGTDGVMEQWGEERADLAGAEAAEEDAADEPIDLRRAVLVARQHGGTKPAVPRAGDVEIGQRTPRGD